MCGDGGTVRVCHTPGGSRLGYLGWGVAVTKGQGPGVGPRMFGGGFSSSRRTEMSVDWGWGFVTGVMGYLVANFLTLRSFLRRNRKGIISAGVERLPQTNGNPGESAREQRTLP